MIALPRHALPFLLRWRSRRLATYLCESIKRRHLTYLTSELSHFLHFHNDNPITLEIRDDMINLPNVALLRLLDAPQTCQAITLARLTGPDNMFHFLHATVKAEWCRLGSNRRTHETAWTALGDYYFPDNARAKTNRCAFRIHDNVFLDLGSPYADQPLLASNFRPPFGPAVPFSESAEEIVISRIRTALEGIQVVNEAAHAVVVALLRVIMPRIDNMNDTFKGSSNRSIIGRVNLINPHLEYVNDTVIASSLIHEAIHSMLYLIEEDTPMVLDRNAAEGIFVVSPWSEKRIHLSAFTHAVYVWYGLLNFWKLRQTDVVFRETTVAYYHDFCSRGFRDDGPLRALTPYISLLDSDALTDIQYMVKTA